MENTNTVKKSLNQIFAEQAAWIERMNKLSETYYPNLEHKFKDLGGLEYSSEFYGHLAG